MNFSGKYQLQSQENFEPFMKAMGECWMGHQSWCNEKEGLALPSAASQGLILRWKKGPGYPKLRRAIVTFLVSSSLDKVTGSCGDDTELE